MKKILIVFVLTVVVIGAGLMLFNKKNEHAEEPRENIPQENSLETRPLFLISFNVNYREELADQTPLIEVLKRHYELMKKYDVKANYYFTGLAAETFSQIDPELLQKIGADPKITLAHHGANRPPNPMPIERVKGENWEQDVRALEEYETHRLNPKTGQIDAETPGGLGKIADEYFQNDIFATGRFFQASILYAEKNVYKVKMAVGLKDNTGAPQNDAWFLGVLNRPDALSIPSAGMLRWATKDENPLPRIERLIQEKMSEKKSPYVLITFPLHDHDFLKPYSEKMWENYEKVIQWAKKYPGMEIVSLSDIFERVEDDRTRTISFDDARRIAEYYVNAVEKSDDEIAAPPLFIDLGDDVFSLADAWQALQQALVKGNSGSQIVSRDILGPTEYADSTDVAALQYIDIGEIVEMTKQASLSGDRVPASVLLSKSGLRLNPAEFLYLMSKALLGTSEEFIELLPIAVLPKEISAIQKTPGNDDVNQADPLTKLQFWTFKPLRWRR